MATELAVGLQCRRTGPVDWLRMAELVVGLQCLSVRSAESRSSQPRRATAVGLRGPSHFSRSGSPDTSLESVEDSELCGRTISSLGL